MKKTCGGCKKILPIDQFNKNRANKDGLQYLCRKCTNAYYKKRRTESRNKRRTGAMKGWTEWHQLPPKVVAAMGEEENKEYCEWWVKAHPIDIRSVAEQLLEAMQNFLNENENKDVET